MIHLAVTAGLRVSELVGLRLDEVFFQSRYVDIHVRGKGHKDRILSLWKEVSDSVHTWMAIRGSVQAPELFLNARGNRMTRAGFEYLLAKHAEAAFGVCPSLRGKRVSPHALRHYVASRNISCAVRNNAFLRQSFESYATYS